MARTYIENSKLPEVKEEYTAKHLAGEFKKKLREIRNSLIEINQEQIEVSSLLARLKKDVADDIKNGRSISYSPEEIQLEETKIQREYDNHLYIDAAREVLKNQQYLKEYGQSFSQLYQIKDEHEKRREDEKLTLTEINLSENRGILTADQYNKLNADPNSELRELALQVDNKDSNFAIVMTEYHAPNSDPQVKMQLSFDDDTLAQLNAEKLKRIFEFCERYGLSTSDMTIHYGYDGSIDVNEELRIQQEHLNEMMAQAKDMIEKEGQARDDEEYKRAEEREKVLRQEYDAIIAANGGKVPEGLSLKDISFDEPIIEDSELLAERDLSAKKESFSQSVSQNRNYNNATAPAPTQQSASVPLPQATGNQQHKITQKEAEEKFDTWIGTSQGLSKRRGYSYFKKHTGFFGKGWAQYTVYDTEDAKNQEEDGRRDKDGHPKYHYSFKLFVKVDENGLHLAYRTPNNKKMDEAIVGGIVGQLRAMGYTHVNFPNGIPDCEKGMWRKALAENGIVPIGIGLDRSKAEGMLKAAKEKLSVEAYNTFKYRLGLQMDKNNKSKGKVVDPTEQDFIDGLINSHKYAAFTEGYNSGLKSKMKKILRTRDPEEGAIKKIAAFRTLSHLYEVYADAVDQGTSFATSPKLTDTEKRLLKQAHLDSNPQRFTAQQMDALFDILYTKQKDDVKKEMYAQLIDERVNPAVYAKRSPKVIINDLYKNARNMCEAINEDLQSKGVDEIGLIKSFDVSLEYGDFLNNYWPQYNRNHPPATNQEESSREPADSKTQTKKAPAIKKNIREV